MFGVGRLGSYISRGVYTVSGPFQPSGGAVDIIVVEQPDGSFKSSPWYVRFGKSQGVLKATERVVSVNVNGVDANFSMYLDNKGEAFFLREVDASEGEQEPYPSCGGELDSKSDIWRTQKSKSCNFDTNRTDLVCELEASERKIIPRTNSPRARIFGLSFGRRSMKENVFRDGEGAVGVNTSTSLERAEIAADLLEVRWTTNLATTKHGNANKVDSSVSLQGNVDSNAPGCQQSCGTEETGDSIPCSINPQNCVEILSLEETYIRVDPPPDRSEISTKVDNGTNHNGCNTQSNFSEVSKSIVKVSCTLDPENNEGCVTSVEEQCSSGNVSWGGSVLDFDLKKEVNEEISSDKVLNLKNNTIVENCSCLSGSNNVPRSEDLCFDTNDLKSLPLVSDKESSTVDMVRQPLCLGAEECSVDSTHERNAYATPSENSEEEQFSFSDLDDPKVERVEEIEGLSPDGVKECLPRDSPESSEDELTETVIRDDESQKLTDKHLKVDISPKVKTISETSPISISKVHKDADLEFLASVVESLPNMPFTGDNLNPYGVPEPLSRSLDSNFEALKMINNDLPDSPKLGSAQQQVAHLQLVDNSSQISEDFTKIVADPAVEVSLCRHMLYEGMGYEAASLAFDAEKLDMETFISLGPNIVKDDKLVVRIGGLYFPWIAAVPIASAIGSQGGEQILEPKGMIAVGQVNKTSEEALQKPMNSKNGSWKIWPFSFKRSNSVKDKKLDSETASESPIQKDKNTDVITVKVTKKKIRAKAPTSEQLASLNLKEGKNVVTFTFFTEQVDARIFLWKWNTRIVISDVDGTITKSDVLGQFMPLMGYDWSQTGVTHLFSAIKENGYHLLFLSARSIAQAYHTRQFLINLKQDGKALPEGPIVISPDGIFPSLYREVIRRAPHEFKISCLEDIKVLFPRDHNPFYAGFGNRETDEFSYLKVGIPKGKIFTINPKGEVVVNRRVDTKSYTSLHSLVHDMFPPTTTVNEQEDYNSWNFWRLPPPDVRI